MNLALDWASVGSAVGLSLLCGVAAVAMALPPGVLLAWRLARGRGAWRGPVELAVLLPMVVPPVVIGYVLLRALAGTALVFTWPAAAMAQAVVAMPLIVLTTRVAMEAMDPQLELAAQQMGASPLRVLVKVALPLSWHAVAAGSLLGFARAVGEFGATILVAGSIPGRTRTVPLAIYSAVQQPGGESTAAALVLIAVALSAAALGVSRWLSRRALRFRF